jgi:hypothetical protein
MARLRSPFGHISILIRRTEELSVRRFNDVAPP